MLWTYLKCPNPHDDHNDTEMNNTNDQKIPTFRARIVDVPNQDTKGNYRYTDYRCETDKRTGEVTDARYYDDWYQFPGVLTSMFVEGQKCEIPVNFKINICIASEPNSEYEGEYRAYLKKLNSILSGIKMYSDVRFKGVPRRLDKSRNLLPVEPTDIENAREIYVSSNYIDTIRVDPPTRETREKQNQFARSRAKERSREFKLGLWVRLKRFWWDIVKFVQDIGKYVTKNIVPLLVGFLFGIASSVIGGLILYWLGVS